MKICDPGYPVNTTHRYSGKKKKELDAVARIDLAIKDVLLELASFEQRRSAFVLLVDIFRRRTNLLRPTKGQGSAGWAAPVFLIGRLRNVAARCSFWEQRCEAWNPRGTSLRLVFRSLLEHLFVGYSVPAFMESTWDCVAGADGFRQQSWYLRLRRGASFRSLNLPIPLTRRMEHYTRQAPDHFTALQGLRYGEVRGLGGGERLAHVIALGQLGSFMEGADFWRSVLIFFLNHPELSDRQIAVISEFLRANKFGGQEVFTATGTQKRSAPWPDFSMHGRTPKSLLRLISSSGWSVEEGGAKTSVWERSGITPFRFLETFPDGAELEWSVVELLNSSALRAEAGAMHHCVYSYTDRCLRRISSIWSLRAQTPNGEKRVATIEINPKTKAIVQVRANSNRRPGERSRALIRQWAEIAGLNWVSAEPERNDP
jgi:hypothetical protein